MIEVLSILTCVLAVVLLGPIVVFTIECCLGAMPRRFAAATPARTASVAVLIPAHNEQGTIGPTVRALTPQMKQWDRLIVVADNCTDGTAAEAAEAGAEVLTRVDADRRGKGYALDFGVQALVAAPPAVVVITDADCRLSPGTIDLLAQKAIETNRAVQARYLMTPADGLRSRISSLAFLVKNFVRPMGLARVGLPCTLTGAGMAFPWELIRSVPLASGNIVEDVQLGIDCALAGRAPVFCPDATVAGELPESQTTAAGQRKRWEHGHLRTMFTQGPRLLAGAIRQRRFDLLALALDVAVPPLALLVMAWAIAMGLAVVVRAMGGSWIPALVLGASGGLLLLSVLLAYLRHGRHLLPAWMLLAVPLYALWKVPLYATFLFRRQKEWVRTERSAPPASDSGTETTSGRNPVRM